MTVILVIPCILSLESLLACLHDKKEAGIQGADIDIDAGWVAILQTWSWSELGGQTVILSCTENVRRVQGNCSNLCKTLTRRLEESYDLSHNASLCCYPHRYQLSAVIQHDWEAETYWAPFLRDVLATRPTPGYHKLKVPGNHSIITQWCKGHPQSG